MGCFTFAASWLDCINRCRSPSLLAYVREARRETGQFAFSMRVEVHVIFMYSICDG